MDVAVLYSGGKDSNYALAWAVKKGLKVKTLVTMVPEKKDSYMFHVPNIHLTEYQAQAMNVPIIIAPTSGEKEKELEELKAILKKLRTEGEISGLVVGAIASKYQKSRIEKLCKDLGLHLFDPLWGIDSVEYLKNLVTEGYKVIIVGVYAQGLDEKWLGRELDEKAIEELIELEKKHKIDLAFEGGEAETFVLDCMLFKKKLEVIESEKKWDGIRGEMNIKELKLVEKEKKEKEGN